MDIRAHANTLLAALCEYRGAEAIALDKEDKAGLDMDGRLFVFAYSEELEELLSLAYIAPLPDNAQRGELLRELLRGNYAWAGTDGGILGLDESSGWICLSKRYRPEQLEPGEFLAKIAVQAGLVDHWRKTLTAVPPEVGNLTAHAIRI
jgi:hypothetical protein